MSDGTAHVGEKAREHVLVSVYDDDDGPWIGYACLCGWASDNGATREQVEEHIRVPSSPGETA